MYDNTDNASTSLFLVLALLALLTLPFLDNIAGYALSTLDQLGGELNRQ